MRNALPGVALAMLLAGCGQTSTDAPAPAESIPIDERRHRRRRDQPCGSRSRSLGHRRNAGSRYEIHSHRRDGRRGSLPGARSAGRQLRSLGPGLRSRRLGKSCGVAGQHCRPRGDGRARCRHRGAGVPGSLLVRNDGPADRGRGVAATGRHEFLPDLGQKHGLCRLPSARQRGDPHAAGHVCGRRVLGTGVDPANILRPGRRLYGTARDGPAGWPAGQIHGGLDGQDCRRRDSGTCAAASHGTGTQCCRDRARLVESEVLHARPVRHRSAQPDGQCLRSVIRRARIEYRRNADSRPGRQYRKHLQRARSR